MKSRIFYFIKKNHYEKEKVIIFIAICQSLFQSFLTPKHNKKALAIGVKIKLVAGLILL